MRPRIIKTEEEYDAALVHLDSLMSARAGTRKMEQLELWTLLVKTYEDEHYPIARPDPVDAIRYWMDQLGLTQSGLVPFIGAKSKVSEVLSGQRPLSKAMIRKLHEGLGIPAEILIGASGPVAHRARIASRFAARAFGQPRSEGTKSA